MKVALCIFGQPRFLDNPHPFKSHKKYILDKYDVDCYCHMWWKSGIKEFDANPWAFKSQKCKATSIDPIALITSQYHPVKIIADEPRNFKLSDNTLALTRKHFPKDFRWSDKILSNICSHLCTIENSVRLIENKSKYDFIIVSRYDNFIHDLPDLYKLNNSKFYLSDHHFRFPDLMYIFGHKFIESQYTFTNMDFLAENQLINFWEPSAECYKYFNYLDKFKKDDLCRIPLPIRVVRGENGFGDLNKLPLKYFIKAKIKLFFEHFQGK